MTIVYYLQHLTSANAIINNECYLQTSSRKLIFHSPVSIREVRKLLMQLDHSPLKNQTKVFCLYFSSCLFTYSKVSPNKDFLISVCNYFADNSISLYTRMTNEIPILLLTGVFKSCISPLLKLFQ